jgi:outer membrane protein OmpA-like peptidoglycan-associated protein
MTKRLPSSLLLGCAALLLFATAAQAQVVRPNNSLYIEARGGMSIYGGDLDNNVDDNVGDYFSDGSYVVGGELGYQFSAPLGFGISFLYGDFPQLSGFDTDAGLPTTRNQIIGAFRYFPFPSSRITPYVRLGVGYVFEASGSPNPNIPGFVGYNSGGGWGPHLGLGVDLLLGRQFSLFLEAQGTAYFPDNAVDGQDPGAAGITGPNVDQVDFDVLGLVGGGARFWFRPGVTRVDATIDCPASLEVGQTGTFTAFVNENATGPLTYNWSWGDGTSASGLVATKSYGQPGTYTVTFTAEGPINTDTETCLVTVTAPPVEAPVLTQCVARPMRATVGETVNFSAQVAGTRPIQFEYDFGDGATANTLTATHVYRTPGTYEATLTATNEAGSDVCTFTVEVIDDFCRQVTELNTVYFGSALSSLNQEAQSRLDENIAVLERCPEICVQIVGYADSRERNPMRLSESRADAVRAYYEQNGLMGNRFSVRGGGVAPDDNYKEDRGAGSRRAESIPTMTCPPPAGPMGGR